MEKTTFQNSNLELMFVSNFQLWESTKYVEIERSSNLEKILKDMNLIISPDQDEMENS